MSATAHITIPDVVKERSSQAAVLASDSCREGVAAVFDRLDGLLASMPGASVETKLTALIPALIERGMDTRERIVGAAQRKYLPLAASVIRLARRSNRPAAARYTCRT